MIVVLVLLIAYVLLKPGSGEQWQGQPTGLIPLADSSSPLKGRPSLANQPSPSNPNPANHRNNPPIGPPGITPHAGVQPGGMTCATTWDDPHACDAWNEQNRQAQLKTLSKGQGVVLGFSLGPLGLLANVGLSALENQYLTHDGAPNIIPCSSECTPDLVAQKVCTLPPCVGAEDVQHTTGYLQTKYRAKRAGGGLVGR